MAILNVEEIKKITALIRDLFPNKFNNQQIEALVDGLSEFSFDSSIKAIKECAIEAGFIGAGEIVGRANLINQERLRSEKLSEKPKQGCASCIRGTVFATQDDYEYAFQCRCSYDQRSPVPMWDRALASKGFKKKSTKETSGPRLWERESHKISCKKCGHNIGDHQRIKIKYRD